MSMLAEQSAAASIAPAPHLEGPHFAPRAKSNICLFMPGGPSHMDMFDPKPALAKYAGQRPDSVNLRTERTTGGLYPSPFKFQKYGRNGIDVSEGNIQIASIIDDICSNT